MKGRNAVTHLWREVARPIIAWGLACFPAGYAVAALFATILFGPTPFVHPASLAKMSAIVFVFCGPLAALAVWIIRRERLVRPHGDVVLGAMFGFAAVWMVGAVFLWRSTGLDAFLWMFELGAGYTAVFVFVPLLAGAAAGLIYWMAVGRP